MKFYCEHKVCNLQRISGYMGLAVLLFLPSQLSGQNSETGILLLAHGGKPEWNTEVRRVAEQVREKVPIEIAFGMAGKRTIQEAADRLTAQGIRRIVAVPLFVSSHSTVITATEYLLKQRAVAPPELARYAQMDHGANHDANTNDSAKAIIDPMKPIESTASILMTGALGRHPLVSEILLARADALSRNPSEEVVIVLAHGPVSDEDNSKWLADLEELVVPLRAQREFHRVEHMTLRDDAPEPIRSAATAELRSRVEQATKEGKRVLLVPLLLSFGGIERGIHERLDGLKYEMSQQALLPDPRISRWVLLQAEVE